MGVYISKVVELAEEDLLPGPSAPFTAHYAIWTMHYELCTMRYELCTMHFALCTLHYALCTMHHSMCTMHYELCTLNYALWTMHYTLCTMHKIDYTLCTMHYAPNNMHYALWTMHYPQCTMHWGLRLLRPNIRRWFFFYELIKYWLLTNVVWQEIDWFRVIFSKQIALEYPALINTRQVIPVGHRPW